MAPTVFTPAAAAQFLRAAGYPIGPDGLAARRKKHQPPEFHRIGNRPVYRPEDLRRFLTGEFNAGFPVEHPGVTQAPPDPE